MFRAVVLAAALALASTSACDRSKSPERDTAAQKSPQRDTPAQTAPSERAPSPSLATTKISNDSAPSVAASADAETVCSEKDVGGDGRGNRAVVREIYSFPKLNQHLAKYPELARAIGLDQVRTCAAARLFAERYHRYNAANPDYAAAEQPSKADSILR